MKTKMDIKLNQIDIVHTTKKNVLKFITCYHQNGVQNVWS